VDVLRRTGGQSVITATDLEQIPTAEEPGVAHLPVADGQVLTEPVAATR
jgi:hypothetical protein